METFRYHTCKTSYIHLQNIAVGTQPTRELYEWCIKFAVLTLSKHHEVPHNRLRKDHPEIYALRYLIGLPMPQGMIM